MYLKENNDLDWLWYAAQKKSSGFSREHRFNSLETEYNVQLEKMLNDLSNPEGFSISKYLESMDLTIEQLRQQLTEKFPFLNKRLSIKRINRLIDLNAVLEINLHGSLTTMDDIEIYWMARDLYKDKYIEFLLSLPHVASLDFMEHKYLLEKGLKIAELHFLLVRSLQRF